MRRFEVIALSVGTNTGKVLQLHDVANEEDFDEGEADELIQEGFLKEIESDEAKAEVKKPKSVKEEKKSLGRKLVEELK